MDVLGLCAGRVDRGGPGLAVHPPRPAAEADARADRLAGHHGFVAWVVAIMFAFAWYRKWGGWSSNEFVATVVALRRPAGGADRLARARA